MAHMNILKKSRTRPVTWSVLHRADINLDKSIPGTDQCIPREFQEGKKPFKEASLPAPVWRRDERKELT
jgi:hypothetical protein